MDILNCPCCDGRAEFVPHSKLVYTFMTRIGRVHCKKCGLSTATGYKAIVIRWWNRRDGKFTVVVETKPGVSNV